MYNDSNTKWFNQVLLTYKDKTYSTDGYLRLSVTTNTDEHKYFNSPTLMLSVSNNLQKSSVLNIQHCQDLVKTFEALSKQENGNDIVIEKKYQKDIKTIFKFSMTSNNERVVVIELISSETDATKVIVPFQPVFSSLFARIKKFTENYDLLCNQLLIEATRYEFYSIMSQLPSLIKGISSQIVSQIPDAVSAESTPTNIEPEVVSQSEVTINDLDKFLGNEMDNIIIPEIDEDKKEGSKNILEIKSEFVKNVLKNDLFNLENKLNSIALSTIPLQGICDEISATLGFNVLPTNNEDEMKSLMYISTKLFSQINKQYTVNNNPIPIGIPILKFNSKEKDQDRIDLALDVLLFIGFIRCVRRRLESKIENAYDNKSMFYLYIRCFLDPLCFSYLGFVDKSKIVSTIINRYRFFKKTGVFVKYDNLIADNNLPEVEEQDIKLFAEELVEKVLDKTKDVVEFHKMLFEDSQSKLPSRNQFSLEQIINEIIPLEVAELTGTNFSDSNISKNFKESHNISEDIWNFYIGNKKVTKESKKTEQKERITPLFRWVEKYIQDIPEKYRSEFSKYIKDLQYSKYDLSSKLFPLDEFDEGIVKALYVWDPESDEKMKTNFTYFASLVESEKMRKHDILTISKEKQESSPWDALDNFLEEK